MLTNILNKVGNTPLVYLKNDEIPNVKIFAKLEYYNPTGSVKDRAACYIINRALNEGIFNQDTVVIESSSGNFGVALSAYTKMHNLKFICVIDNNTLPVNEMLIKLQGAEIIKITEPDEYGGYLLNRIRKIKELLVEMPNLYWVNQYANTLNAEAYYGSLGREICQEAPGQRVEYVFMGVSSGGTITGVSKRVKKEHPNAKIIAVDIYGSVIFGDTPRKRYIPGIGSSIQPEILEQAIIDEVVLVSEYETILCCKELLEKHNLYAGGSSGSVYAAIKKYFKNREMDAPVNVMCVFADRGERYIETIYNQKWSEMIMNSSLQENLL
ncbi:2,3-diaminopropionate biosynthesis protein SbnA [Mucilaginibacter sp. SJ]|uniref:2,3-diaminopropionate biosynthesis protein SbnA n=1 Tax=Mucilaginibacter sp. SJ TaxID=3029053 RepID=UPI0023A95F5B|nr:2,3-diaminopropionate biosynthesis protein SbnA [Mucilaginibacter sp. SJ]WEA01633.1 2,3-diaminopropionate biosynthesis protein SbnA [Mucilaginibacter sp. SJ]